MTILSTLHQWDARLLKRLFQHGQRRHSLIQLSRILSRSGDGYLQVAFPVTAWLLASPAASAYTAALTLALTIERAVYLIPKNGLQRRRPQEILPSFSALVVPSDRFSFPSGHTLTAFCLATMTGIVFGGPFLTLYGWACGIGLTRVLLGPRFPGDTNAGAIIGSAIAMMVASQLGLA